MGTKNANGPKPKPAFERNSGSGQNWANRRPRTNIGWGDIRPSAIGEFVQAVSKNGHGVILGRTSDGGALSITILDGDERVRHYPASPDAFYEFAEWYDTATGPAHGDNGK